MEEKHHCRTNCVLSDAWIRDLQIKYYISEKLLLSQKVYVTSKEAVSHNVLYYQQLSIARYQVTIILSNYQ